jgi:DNA polymerase-3 subunit chi
MTEISFHFNVPDKMAYACRVLRKAVNSGNKVVVAAEPPTLAQLDIALWAFTSLDFIPHCLANADAALVTSSPVVLGGLDAPGTPRQLLLNMGSSVAAGFERFEKLIELVTNDEDDRQAARARWKHYASRGYAITRHDLAANMTAGSTA